jgi:hypothetical protein
MLRLTNPRHVSTYLTENKCRAYATLLAIALTAPNAYAGGDALKVARPTFGAGVPEWVVRACRPETGAEMLAKIAGPGEWFYRGSGDYCYLDTRSILY